MYTYIFLSEILWYSEAVLIRIDVLYVYFAQLYNIYTYIFEEKFSVTQGSQPAESTVCYVEAVIIRIDPCTTLVQLNTHGMLPEGIDIRYMRD